MICPSCKEETKTIELHMEFSPVHGGFVFICPPKAERSEVLQGCPPSATGSADARASDEAGADSAGRSADVSGSAEQRSEKTEQQREWLRMVIMVENTETNRTVATLVPDELKRIADRFEGKKIVKGESVSVFIFANTLGEMPKDVADDAHPAAGERAGLPNSD